MLSYAWMCALLLPLTAQYAVAADRQPVQSGAVVAAALERANERARAGDSRELIEAELVARLGAVGVPGPDYIAPAWDVYAPLTIVDGIAIDVGAVQNPLSSARHHVEGGDTPAVGTWDVYGSESRVSVPENIVVNSGPVARGPAPQREYNGYSSASLRRSENNE